MTVRELLTLALYDWYRIAVGALIPIGLGLIAAILASSWYESSADLLFLRGSEYQAKSPLIPELGGPGLEPRQVLMAESELIDNRNLLLQAIDEVGIDKIYPKLSARDRISALERLKSDLKIEPVFSAGVLRLTLRNVDAKTAKATLDKIIQLYLNSRMATVGNQNIEPMTRQADQMADRLRQAEDALHRFRVDHGILDMDVQRDQLLQLRSDLEKSHHDTDSLIVSRRSELEAAQKQLAAIPPTLRQLDSNGRIHELENAKASLLTMELRRRDLVSRVSESSEEVANIDLQIATVRSFIATEPALMHDSSRQAPNAAYDFAQRHIVALDADVKGLEANSAEVAKGVAAVTERLSNLDRLAPDYDRLVEAEHTAEEPLLAFLPMLEDLKINDELVHRKSTNVRIIENATLPTKRHSNRGIYLFLGVFIGFIGGLAATFGKTTFRQGCILPGEMEQWLNIKSILAVSYVEPQGVR